MNPVAIAKIVWNNNKIAYRIMFDNRKEDIDETSLEYRLRRGDVKVQNLAVIKDNSSFLNITKLDFSVGHSYPELYQYGKINKYANRLTLLGYTVNNNGKFFILSNAEGSNVIVSNLEIGLLEKYDVITNASYCKDGKVKLDGGKMEEVSPQILKRASILSPEQTQQFIAKHINACKADMSPRALGNPDFGRLDELEKQLPDASKRRQAYVNMYNTPELSGPSLSDIGTGAALLGLGAASFLLDSVVFAGKMRLGNAILDSILDR